jgi:predicted enzyme related to lactoylglutathione lyase
VDEAANRVRETGGQVINGPMDVPGGDRIAQCLDPQGAMFAVHGRPKAA